MRDLLLPAALLGIMACLIMPVPPGILDFLLAGSLVLALLLLVSALCLTDPLKLSALPSILLIATLFRLAVNISTTRMILGSGAAGKVIEVFGSLVIGDTLVVGIIIFLIISLVQFVVIAKGAERVAEVAARFTLDALPGKQMSIDADVRAGLIDFAAAREKRQALQTESRFYGALDGAMKFIKGDAVAGLIIVSINICGGLFTGLFVHDLDIGTALQRYTMLSIGDGLVTQIPALLNALAAGMIITRVSRGEEETLSGEILSQLGQIAPAKTLIGSAACAAAIFSKLPALPFLILGALLIVSAWAGEASAYKRAVSAQQKELFAPRAPSALCIELPPHLLKSLQQASAAREMLESTRRGVFQHSGLLLENPEFLANPKLSDSCLFSSRGVPVCALDCARGDLHEFMKKLSGLITTFVIERGAELIDDVFTKRLLAVFEKQIPELVSTVVPGTITLTQLSEVLRALVREGITIRNIDVILQSIAETAPRTKTERGLLEEVRVALRRVISHRFAAEGELKGITLLPSFDLQLSRAERETDTLPLENISLLCRVLESGCASDAVVVSKASRRLLKECLELRGYSIPVLAYEEIAPDIRFTPVQTVGKENETMPEERTAYEA